VPNLLMSQMSKSWIAFRKHWRTCIFQHTQEMNSKLNIFFLVSYLGSDEVKSKIGNVFVIGGSGVFAEAMNNPLCTRIHLTNVFKVRNMQMTPFLSFSLLFSPSLFCSSVSLALVHTCTTGH